MEWIKTLFNKDSRRKLRCEYKKICKNNYPQCYEKCEGIKYCQCEAIPNYVRERQKKLNAYDNWKIWPHKKRRKECDPGRGLVIGVFVLYTAVLLFGIAVIYWCCSLGLDAGPTIVGSILLSALFFYTGIRGGIIAYRYYKYKEYYCDECTMLCTVISIITGIVIVVVYFIMKYGGAYVPLWMLAFIVACCMIFKLIVLADTGERFVSLCIIGAITVFAIIMWVVLWDSHWFWSTICSIIGIGGIIGLFKE